MKIESNRNDFIIFICHQKFLALLIITQNTGFFDQFLTRSLAKDYSP